MTKYNELAQTILENVGGEENISNMTHCMTRLRFNLKDQSKVNEESLKSMTGVLGVVQSGGQYQIIIGQTVNKVYNNLLELTGKAQEQEEVEAKEEKEPFTLKGLGNKVLDYLAGSLTPLIPVLIAASMFKMVMAVFGPSMLNWIHEGSSLATLLTFVGDAGFYFFPVFLGYTAAKKFGVTPVLGMFLGGVLLHPTFTQIAADGAAFDILGIPVATQNYASTVLPMILSIWIMSYVEKFFKKVIPSTLGTIFTPTLTMVVMLSLIHI